MLVGKVSVARDVLGPEVGVALGADDDVAGSGVLERQPATTDRETRRAIVRMAPSWRVRRPGST